MPPEQFDRILKRQVCPTSSLKNDAGAGGSGVSFTLWTVVFKHCLVEF
jgi:hypothetical protein